MPLLDTTGSNTADAYGGGAAAVPNYIEDVFSTYLYTGNGSTQTITNGIDLSTKGGLVWTKDRTVSFDHALFDTNRGYGNFIKSNSSSANINDFDTLTSFNTNGFSLGSDGNYGVCNLTGNYVSWTFRKQPKFFDVVTWTGNGGTRTLSHNLGSVPGCMIVKKTDSTQDWSVYHRGLTTPATDELYLNLTSAANTGVSTWNNANPTSTTFSVDSARNANTSTYVAYIFAHNAGGFGLTGTDNVISCGSATGGTAVNLGYEPQWVITKKTTTTSAWYIVDNMRGWTAPAGDDSLLASNTSAAEFSSTNYANPTATGFIVNAHTDAYIYIAIRRGPMKVPTDGTKVFKPLAVNNSSGTVNTTGFPIDMQMQSYRSGLSGNAQVIDRLRGISSTSSSGGVRFSGTSNTNAESSPAIGTNFDNTGFATGGSWAGSDMSYLNFRRAPSFFDEVCYTGVGGTSTTVSHNLGVTPELIIYKPRSTTGNWPVAASAVGFTKQSNLNLTDNFYANYDLTATSATVIATAGSNSNGTTYVAYLFATCPGVSKVGIYTGNGTTQAIACGFTGGARFVLIKRTDDVGDWYVYDTARGMTTLTDPYLLINSTAAESATLGSVTTTTGGFTVNASILSAINTNSASYLFLAIA